MRNSEIANPNEVKARQAWGEALPDWVLQLAIQCDKVKSQGRVAKGLGVSAAMVNQVLGNLYKGQLTGIETRVRGELMKAVVQCPILGELSTRDCLDNHIRPFAATNPQRRMLAQACPSCPHNTKKGAQ